MTHTLTIDCLQMSEVTMNHQHKRAWMIVVAGSLLGAASLLQAQNQSEQQSEPGATPPEPAPAESFSVLVFSRTKGYRHDSIPAGIDAIKELGKAHHFEVLATEDPTAFNDATLSAYRVVVFLNTTGDVLDDDQQAAFERFIARGNGFVGIHAAADTEYDWPWYGQLVGAYFHSHPAIQQADIIVEDHKHPSTIHLPDRWHRTDEWYNFRTLPGQSDRATDTDATSETQETQLDAPSTAGSFHILMRLDESSYTGGTMGSDHPTCWCHDFAGGKAWYTGSGHTRESYTDPAFRQHLLGGILWAAGQSHDEDAPKAHPTGHKIPAKHTP